MDAGGLTGRCRSPETGGFAWNRSKEPEPCAAWKSNTGGVLTPSC